MSEEEILESQNLEDIDFGLETESLDQISDDDILAELAKTDDLDIDLPDDNDAESIDDLMDAIADTNVEEDILDSNDFLEEISGLDEDLSTSDDTVAEIEEESSIDELDALLQDESIEEENESLEMTEPEPVEEIEEPTIEEEQIELQEEIVEEPIIAPVAEEEPVVEEVIEEEIVEEVPCDENLITNDFTNIKIEFGIEARGFILSIKMMEAMIEKGYIFKDMLDNKVFDAIMIFNGNLENTVVTDDIKIKIDNGKILLIRA